MLSRPTTFVLGAGASHDLKLPTGDGLQERISQLLQIDGQRMKFANERMWHGVLPHLQGGDSGLKSQRLMMAAAKIMQGMPVAASIDNFLHTHQDDADIVLVGKLGIALAIIEAEAQSHLRSSGDSKPLSTKAYRASWYFPFIRMLTMGTLSNDPRALFENVKFVVFNYDRCLELVLLHTLQGYYGLNDAEAAAVLEQIDIIHPYGSIGPLTGRDFIPFGVSEINLGEVAQGIRTFTESVDTGTLERARGAVRDADVIVFLGFGFLPQNMDLLSPGDERKASRVHATTFGFSSSDKQVLKDRLKQFVGPPATLELGEMQFVGLNGRRSGFIDVENDTCADLINNHRMRLT